MKESITVNEHKSVGPIHNIYDHALVISIKHLEWKEHDSEHLWACLDCGYTVGDSRAFLHEDCVRERNGVNQTFREYLEENDYPDGD